jgi:hypothetical protein
MSRILYIDAIAGASGDMLLGALLDAGVSAETLQSQLNRMNLAGYSLRVHQVSKNGFRATKLDVDVSDEVHERRLPDLLAVLDNSQLSESIKLKAHQIISRLGEAEAHIHGIPLDHVHLHELGGIDTIIDIAGFLISLEILKITDILSSPLPLGRGFINSAHGRMPLPSPATLALLKDVPVYGIDIDKETVTPTGAALISSLTSAFGAIPNMTIQKIGIGAGGRDLPIPNILRAIIGEADIRDHQSVESLIHLETNIDDQNPQFYDFIMDSLFRNGALDVFLTPVIMKKSRPATILNVLCQAADADKMITFLFKETTTLGIRKQFVERLSLQRSFRDVETPYGNVRIKLAYLDNELIKFSPEYEDCRRLAELTGNQLIEVYRSAEQAARQNIIWGSTTFHSPVE